MDPLPEMPLPTIEPTMLDLVKVLQLAGRIGEQLRPILRSPSTMSLFLVASSKCSCPVDHRPEIERMLSEKPLATDLVIQLAPSLEALASFCCDLVATVQPILASSERQSTKETTDAN